MEFSSDETLIVCVSFGSLLLVLHYPLHIKVHISSLPHHNFYCNYLLYYCCCVGCHLSIVYPCILMYFSLYVCIMKYTSLCVTCCCSVYLLYFLMTDCYNPLLCVTISICVCVLLCVVELSHSIDLVDLILLTYHY